MKHFVSVSLQTQFVRDPSGKKPEFLRPGVCEGKEGPGREALVSPEWGKNRLFLPQVYSGAAGCQEPLLTGAHYLALNGKVGGGVLLPTPSPQAQWKKGSRALVTHRLAIPEQWASRQMSQ